MDHDHALGQGQPMAHGGSSRQGARGQPRSRSPYGCYRRCASLGVGSGLRGQSRTRSPPRRHHLHPKTQVTPESCKTYLGGWLLQQDPEDHGGTVAISDGPWMLVEDEIPAPIHTTLNQCEDPMLLEATLAWAPTEHGEKAVPPILSHLEQQQK